MAGMGLVLCVDGIGLLLAARGEVGVLGTRKLTWVLVLLGLITSILQVM